MASPAIPPPPAPAPDDVNPDLGPASRGSGSNMDRFRSIINHLSGGGTPAIQERLAADFAKRQQDAENFRNQAKQATAFSTHAKATVGPGAPFGINPITSKPATAEDVQGWHNDITTGTQGYLKLLPKDAKPIAQKLFEVVHHATGHKGGTGAAPLLAEGDFGGETGRPTTIPPPPQGAATQGAAAGPAIPPPPNQPPPAGAQSSAPSASANPMEIPVSMSAQTLGAPELARMTGVQNELAASKQAQEQQLAATLKSKQTGELEAPAITQQQLESIRQMPKEDRIPAMMHMGIIPPTMMHPSKVVVPNDPANPSAGAHVEFISPMQMMMDEGEGPAAFVPSGQLGTQKTTTSAYNPEKGTTTTTATTRKVAGGRVAGPSVSAGGGTSAQPESSAKPQGRIASMAQDYADFGKVPAAKDSPAVETYMKEHGQTPGVKPTVQEINLADSVRKVEPKLQQMVDFLEKNNLTGKGEGGLLSLDAWTERGKVQKAWEEYSHGLPPKDKQLGQLIKYAAALKVMGAAPWMSMGRGKYIYQEVVQHLPSTTDTPAQLYQKAQFFQSILEDTKSSLPQQLLKPRAAIPPPSTNGGKSAPTGVIHWGRDAQGNPVQLSAGH